MIKTIKIRGFKSFPKDREVVIDLSTNNKPIAMFYGLNGAGKSAIGQVVDRIANKRDVPPGCQLETTGNLAYRYLVYGQDFIDRSFRNAEGFPGIFTIGEPQAESLRRREAIEGELPPLDERLVAIRTEMDTLGAAREQANTTLGRTIWASFQALKSSPLRTLVRYGNDRNGFIERVRGTPVNPGDPPSLDALAKRMTELGDGQAEPKEPTHFDLSDLVRLGRDPVWSTPIEGSPESSLAPLIERLKNQDWVKHGQAHLHNAEGQCPFCQQTLPPGFERDLYALFDASYEQKIAYLRSASINYEASVERFNQALDHLFAQEQFAAEDPALQAAAADLRRTLADNVSATRLKLEAPSSATTIRPIDDNLSAFNEAVRSLNERIAGYNDRIGRRKDELVSIDADLWQRLAHDAAPALTLYSEADNPRKSRMEQLRGSQRDLFETIDRMRQELVGLHSGTASIDEAVVAINAQLSFLGMDGFSIKKAQDRDHLYQLARPGQDRGDFVSLSEGEKTLITFLYFLELVKGSAEQAAALPPKQTIVVVDDPISSLSHNHVYDIAMLIARHLTPDTANNPGGIRQLIVLTHSLFFFHELIHGSHKLHSHMLFKRVTKQPESDVVTLSKDELGNDYDAFWQVVKDAHGTGPKPATLANAMRCILERFFVFTSEEKKFDDVLANLANDNPGFRSFARYLDRGSHADRTNVTDFGDYDVGVCLEHFRRIFDACGHPRHYERKMGLEPAPA